MDGPMQTLRDKASRLLAGNLRTMRGAGRPMSLEARAGRAWDLPAKIEATRRIVGEESARAKAEAKAAGASNPHDDRFDALRHARASKRLAEVAGPAFAEAAGTFHEVENVFDQLVPAFRRQGFGGPYETADVDGRTPGQVVDEIRMDLHNNAEGRAAAREGRAIDPARLRTAPTTQPPTALYRSPPAWRTGLPPR